MTFTKLNHFLFVHPEEVIKKLESVLSKQHLPGPEAQYKMSSIGRKSRVFETFGTKPHRIGAVLVLLYPHENGLYFPLTQRHEYKGVHSGQVSLPGGKAEPYDKDPAATALRETEEEIGVVSNKVQVLGRLTELYIPPSNFLVHPYVGYLQERPRMVKDDREVAELFEANIDTLLDENVVGHTSVKVGNGMKIKTPYFGINDKVVWGATAMILSELKETFKEIYS